MGWEESIGDRSAKVLTKIFLIGAEFDVATVLIVNTPWLLLCLLPSQRRWFGILKKALFVILNGLCIFASLCDTAFYHYANRRLSVSMLKEFAGETNFTSIFLAELPDSWPLALMLALMIAALLFGYRKGSRISPRWNLAGWVLIWIAAMLSWCGRRIVNPFVSLDERYVNENVANTRQLDFAVNTPFKIYFSTLKQELEIPDYYSREDLERIMPVMHRPDTARPAAKRNVVVIIVESLSQELLDSRLTPFLDSLRQESVRFERSFANGSISIDAMPSIFSSIPRMKSSFVLSHNANSHIPSLARELGNWGYHTAFFHGGNNASMGFQAFARSIGFEEYYGRDEYNADKGFGGDADFDGTWAVWDERFLQFTALRLDRFSQPFLAGIFTATSHHPYNVPKDFSTDNSGSARDKMERAVRYTDFALRRFFETASRQQWYGNTIFVITADHVNPISKKGHRHGRNRLSSLRRLEIPIFIFDPTGSTAPGQHEGLVQQIDIMPTVLWMLGYDREFVSLGKNALAQDSANWVFNCSEAPLYIEGDYLYQMRNSGRGTLTDWRKPSRRRTDLTDSLPELSRRMETRTKAFMQNYKIITAK